MNTNYPSDVAILADDLSSAADGASPFVTRGLSASIGRGQLPGQASNVIAVDSGSRSASPAKAVALVARLSAQLGKHRVFYKTVDSTLRGHITAELEACFQASGRQSLVFAPAFPAAGRTTLNGIQRVDGIPVADSLYGRDPVHPARHSALAALIPPSIKSVTLLDARTQEELNAQIAAIQDPESVLWVGSPGMAIALAQGFPHGPGPAPWASNLRQEVLVVIGSANPRSHRQAELVQQIPGVTVLRSPVERVAEPGALLDQLAETAAQTLQDSRFGSLIATGGDTMEAILARLGIHEFQILQELEPGFPLARARLSEGRSLLLAMKAGGFGSEHSLQGAIAQIHPTSLHPRKDSQ